MKTLCDLYKKFLELSSYNLRKKNFSVLITLQINALPISLSLISAFWMIGQDVHQWRVIEMRGVIQWLQQNWHYSILFSYPSLLLNFSQPLRNFCHSILGITVQSVTVCFWFETQWNTLGKAVLQKINVLHYWFNKHEASISGCEIPSKHNS